MNNKRRSTVHERIGDIAPKLADLTEDVLFGDVWERPALSKRDRSLATVSALVAMNRTEQLTFHIQRAIENGVTKEEIVEVINRTLRRNEESRIYHWVDATGSFPPRRPRPARRPAKHKRE